MPRLSLCSPLSSPFVTPRLFPPLVASRHFVVIAWFKHPTRILCHPCAGRDRGLEIHPHTLATSPPLSLRANEVQRGNPVLSFLITYAPRAHYMDAAIHQYIKKAPPYDGAFIRHKINNLIHMPRTISPQDNFQHRHCLMAHTPHAPTSMSWRQPAYSLFLQTYTDSNQ